MSIPRKHHYVPAFYLNNWGDDSDNQKNKKVFCWGNQNGKIIHSSKSTSSICSERDLYAKEADKPKDMQAIELEYFKKLDDKFSKILPKLTSEGSIQIDNDQRLEITKFIISLRLRHPQNIQYSKNITEKFFSEMLREHEPQYKQDKLDEWPDSLENLMEIKLPNLKNNMAIESLPRCIEGENDDKIHQTIFNMHWVVIDITRSKWTLLTSDKPVIFTDKLDSNECLICLPLSPYKALIAAHSEKILKDVDFTVGYKIDEIVKRLNISIANQSPKWIISNTLFSDRFIKKYYCRRLQS